MILVDLYLRLKGSHANLDAIQITKVKGGTLEESFLDEGKMSSEIENLKVYRTIITIHFLFIVLTTCHDKLL